MKKIMAMASALMLAVAMVGCAGGATNLDREVTADGFTWKVSSGWVEKIDETSVLKQTDYVYSNGKEDDLSGYDIYAWVKVCTGEVDSAIEEMQQSEEIALGWDSTISYDCEELDNYVKDGAQVSTYKTTEVTEGNDEELTLINYEGFVIRPGIASWRLTCDDEATFNAIMDSLSIA